MIYDEKSKVLTIFDVYRNCIDFSDSVKTIIHSDFFVFNLRKIYLPSLGMCLETAEHITSQYVDEKNASS